MDTLVRDIKIGLSVSPIFWDELPDVDIQFNNTLLFTGLLGETKTFDMTLPALDKNKLIVFFKNKKDSDTVDGKDKAVVINYVEIEGYRYNSFVQRANYVPEYSEGYYNYAKENNLKVKSILHTPYMGFNGEWFLEIDWPTFSWIYDIETSGMGWVYEKNI